MRRSFVCLFFLIFLTSCSLADIRPPHLAKAQNNKELEIRAKKFFNNIQDPTFAPSDWKRFKQIQFLVTDSWNSSFVRFFTPVKIAEQKMKVQFNFEKQTMEVEFLNGPNSGVILGLAKREPYQIATETGKVFTGDAEVRLYLESLRLYILLPWQIPTYPVVQYAGESKLFGNRLYETIYASTGTPEATPDTDQFLAYYEKASGALEWLQFTYREVFSFYKGVLKYGSYELWNGKMVPRKITILDNFEDTSYVHEIRIERIEVPKTPLAEETPIQEQN